MPTGHRRRVLQARRIGSEGEHDAAVHPVGELAAIGSRVVGVGVAGVEVCRPVVVEHEMTCHPIGYGAIDLRVRGEGDGGQVGAAAEVAHLLERGGQHDGGDRRIVFQEIIGKGHHGRSTLKQAIGDGQGCPALLTVSREGNPIIGAGEVQFPAIGIERSLFNQPAVAVFVSTRVDTCANFPSIIVPEIPVST